MDEIAERLKELEDFRTKNSKEVESIGEYIQRIDDIADKALKEDEPVREVLESRLFENCMRDYLVTARFKRLNFNEDTAVSVEDVAQEQKEDEKEKKLIEFLNNKDNVAAPYLRCAHGILKNSETNKVKRFIAFYILSTYFRRNGELALCKWLFKEYHREFLGEASAEKRTAFRLWPFGRKDEPTSLFANPLEHIRLESIDSKELKLEDIKDAEKLCEKMGEQAGVHIMYANMVVRYLDEHSEWNGRQEYLEKAERHINEAIRSEKDYPKTHIIKAQVLGKLGNYPEAIKSAKKGIRLQKLDHRNDEDYTERLVKFYDCQFTLEIEEQERKLAEKQKELERAVKGTQAKNIELLALFTAVIGVIVGSLQIAGNGLDARLIFVLFASVIVAFICFRVLNYVFDNKKLAPLLLGVILGIALMCLFAVIVLCLAKIESPENVLTNVWRVILLK